jgi:AraC-like DNA-binding protein
MEKEGCFEQHALHIHESLEICVLRENEAVFHLLDRDYDGRPGDVFLFRPFDPHWPLTRDARKPIGWVMVLFSPIIVKWIPGGIHLLAPFYVRDRISPHVPAHSEYARNIQQSAFLALEEQAEKRIGWEAKQFQYLVDILVQLNRYAENQISHLSEAMDHRIIQCIEYILGNYSENLSTDDFISRFDLKRTHFYESFKRLTGLSPNAFINRLRLQMSMYLLKNQEMPITRIALECGFQSVSYFNYVFKSHLGEAPRNYRNRIKSTKDMQTP